MRALVWLVLLAATPLGATELRDVRLWAGPDSTRVVFDLTGEAAHKLYTLSGPERIVIDLPDVKRAEKLSESQDSRGYVLRVRHGDRPEGVRVVLDVSETVKPKSFIILPNGEYGFRLVVDLYGQPPAAPATPAAAPAPAPAPVPMEEKPIVIAVDAGHGGEDPGTRGRSGTLEKDVALDLARRLARLINAESGFQAVLVRDGDYYVGLRKRIDKARDAQADLFVSIHANSYKDRSVSGSAVYVLSPRGASSEHARWLASHENAADLIGGVDIQDRDDTLAAVLIDISQTSAIEASYDLGERLLTSLGKVNALQKKRVQEAGFAVLKAPDIPSVLIETAFLTNEREERLLGDPAHQQKLARSMLDGIKGYFASYRPLQQVADGRSSGGSAADSRAAP